MLKKLFKITVTVMAILWIGGYGVFIANIVIKFTPPSPNALEKTDAVIVLTGGNNRVKTGLELLVHGASDNLFITGVNISVKKKDIISIWQGKDTLPDCCITLGYKATTTMENASEAKNWIDEKKIKTVRLVTSAYHMDRALLEFKHRIKNIKIIPHPVMETGNQLQVLNFWKITFSEYNKVLFRSAIIIIKNKG